MPFAEESHPEPTPAYTLFDANAVSLATFFGTPVAGASLMALNDRRLGRAGRAVTTLVLAVAVTALVVLLGWNIPQGFSAPIAIALVFAMRYIALPQQGDIPHGEDQRNGDGSRKTLWNIPSQQNYQRCDRNSKDERGDSAARASQAAIVECHE